MCTAPVKAMWAIIILKKYISISLDILVPEDPVTASLAERSIIHDHTMPATCTTCAPSNGHCACVPHSLLTLPIISWAA